MPSGYLELVMRHFMLSTLLLASTPVLAETVIDKWAQVKPPSPAPDLKTVTVDPKTSALLLLDFNGAEGGSSGPCNAATKPSCIASLPAMRKLLDKARASGMLVIYSVITMASRADIRADLVPLPEEAVVRSSANKFVGTDLAKLLNAKRIKTVIVTGTASEGAVLDTVTAAELEQGMSAIIPVDGMSSTDLYSEQYVVWHMTHAPGVSAKTVLTRSDLITF